MIYKHSLTNVINVLISKCSGTRKKEWILTILTFSLFYFILFSYYDGSQCDLVLKSKDFETKQINLLFFSLIFLICKMELITESLQVCFKMSVEQLTGQVPSSHHYHHYLHLLCLRGVVSKWRWHRTVGSATEFSLYLLKHNDARALYISCHIQDA